MFMVIQTRPQRRPWLGGFFLGLMLGGVLVFALL